MPAVPTTAHEIRDWLRALKKDSGLSFAQIAEAIGEDERNVKRWMTVSNEPVLPRGDVVLKLLSALGVTLTPPAPGSVLALNAQLQRVTQFLVEADHLIEEAKAVDADPSSETASIDDRLRALEDTVETAGAAVTTALDALAREVRALAQQTGVGDSRATDNEAAN